MLQGQCEMYTGSRSSHKRKFVVATVGSGEFLWDVDYLCGSPEPPYVTGAPVQLSIGARALSECKVLSILHGDLLRVLWADTLDRMRKAAQIKMSWRQVRVDRRQKAREAQEKALNDAKVGLKALPRSVNVDTSQLSATIMMNISGMRCVKSLDSFGSHWRFAIVTLLPLLTDADSLPAHSGHSKKRSISREANVHKLAFGSSLVTQTKSGVATSTAAILEFAKKKAQARSKSKIPQRPTLPRRFQRPPPYESRVHEERWLRSRKTESGTIGHSTHTGHGGVFESQLATDFRQEVVDTFGETRGYVSLSNG